jgi:hypothetical protein
MAPPEAAPIPPPVSGPPQIVVPHPEDLRLAHDDSLLQLRIGRLAHTNAVIVSGVLLLDAILVLYIHFVSPHGVLAPWGATLAIWLPLVAALYLAAASLASKWSVFQLWPWERHFSLSAAALVYSAAMVGLTAFLLFEQRSLLTTTQVLVIYPLALLGISLALLGLIATWSGWRRRQWIGLVAALLPLPFALLVYWPSSAGAQIGTALAISLFLSATSYQTAGSMLHLIASGTPIHERELITSGQSRMFRLAHEIQRREHQVRDRESNAGRRETDTVYTQMELRRQQTAIEEAREQLERLEADYRTRADSLARLQSEWVSRSSEVNARAQALEEAKAALEAREKALEAALANLSAREQRVMMKEGDLARREVDLTTREQELLRRTPSAPSRAPPSQESTSRVGAPSTDEAQSG